ncbi:MAG: RNA polymerase subunit sigma-24 [Thaumarchaeota archaeon]|nr:MAG: RNA polymerase subunit sigma-24 [Nitrososphaerota archaeon]
MKEREPDELLVKRFQKGEIEAFDELFRRYRRRVYEIAYRFTRNVDDALDLTQEIFLKVFKSLGTFKFQSSFYTWLFSTARNYCIDYLRHRRVKRVELQENMPSSSPDYLFRGARVPPPSERIEREELRKAIEKAIESLPPKQREVFILRHYEGLQLKEIAEIVGKRIGTVKANLFHATRKLAEMLRPYIEGGEDEV